MSSTATMLADALLDHHLAFCVPHTARPPIVGRCVITYRDLCREAGTPGLERGVGRFLQEVAEWCAACGYPPINSLAVNAETRMPGDSHDLAPGCSIVTWEAEAAAAIVFAGYPAARLPGVLNPRAGRRRTRALTPCPGPAMMAPAAGSYA